RTRIEKDPGPSDDREAQLSINQSESVDVMGIDKQTGRVSLGISDHLRWDAPLDSHLAVLERKLATYVHFVRSGQLLMHYPDAASRGVSIQLICKYRVSVEGASVLLQARAALEAEGIAFSYMVLPEPRSEEPA